MSGEKFNLVFFCALFSAFLQWLVLFLAATLDILMVSLFSLDNQLKIGDLKQKTVLVLFRVYSWLFR